MNINKWDMMDEAIVDQKVKHDIEIAGYVKAEMELWNIPMTAHNIQLIHTALKKWAVQPQTKEDVQHIITNSLPDLEDQLQM